jgi:hypothetical protein
VLLSGVLDETADLAPIKSLSGSVVISFKEVLRINSCGVRDWINALASAQLDSMTYEECPMVIVKQINAVPAFVGKASILSFYAPYYCNSCDAEENTLILSQSITTDEPPKMNCSKCKQSLTFDAIPNQYFAFLKRQKG